MRKFFWVSLSTILILSAVSAWMPAWALPPASDPPEEVLRTEIITEARSPVDGQPLTAGEYAELEAQLQTSRYPPTLSPAIQRTVRLLYLRRAIRAFFPFLLR
jgi:hypothetical protein